MTWVTPASAYKGSSTRPPHLSATCRRRGTLAAGTNAFPYSLLGSSVRTPGAVLEAELFSAETRIARPWSPVTGARALDLDEGKGKGFGGSAGGVCTNKA
jgi:hypothetical protein